MGSKQVVAIIEPMSCGREYILQARKMGYEVLVFSANTGERKLTEKYSKKVDHFCTVDSNNDTLVIEQCRALATRLNIVAVIPGFEYFVPLAAKLSSALNLPGLDPQQADALRLKHLMREHLVKHKLLSPEFACVETEQQFLHELRRFRFPVVIKPVDCSGSMNVRRVDNEQSALNAFRQIIAREYIDMERPAIHKVLIEEYISGRELSIDGFVEKGNINVLSLTEKLLGEEPYFVEAGHIVEGIFNKDEKEQVLAYAKNVVAAFNITMGPFHCEVRLSSRGPVLMEIAARLPGDQISELIGFAKNVNIYEISLNCYLGHENPPLQQLQNKYAGVRFIIRPGLHTFQMVEGLNHFIDKPWTKEITMYYHPGDQIPEATDWLGRIGFGIFEADTYKELIERMETFNRNVLFN